MKPITIGISCSNRVIQTHFSSNQHATVLPSDYLLLFQNHPVIPFILSCHIPLSAIDDACTKIDGLFLIGGADIDPSYYNEQPQVTYIDGLSSIGVPFTRPASLRPNAQQDAFEIALYRAAKKLKIPVFGNCRGMQLMNVADGGSLFQEILPSSIDHLVGSDGWAPHHEVIFTPKSVWSSYLGKEVYTTSTSHHQAIKKLAPNFTVSATALDSGIEMIECVNSSEWLLGIQGHIEKLVKNFHAYRNVIEAFIQEAQKRKKE